MNAITPRQRTIFARLVDALTNAGRTHEIEDVMRALRTGDAQIWVENDSVVVTEVLVFPKRTVLRYWLAAGDMDDMLTLLPKLEQWGREQGATLAEMVGRRGWRKEAAAHGYEAAATIYRKDI
jgi:hypothetical protein